MQTPCLKENPFPKPFSESLDLEIQIIQPNTDEIKNQKKPEKIRQNL
jgi:hypothetical protein